MITYLDLSNIEKIRESLGLEDLEKGYIYKGGLEFTLSQVQDLYDNDIQNEKEMIASKTGYLIQQITKGHFYSGGNKRTALLTADIFLNLNGYNLRYDEGAGFMMTMSVFYDQLKDNKLIEWILGHMEERV